MTSSAPEMRFRQHIESPDFPCVGAKSALARDQMNITTAGSILDNGADPHIYKQLIATGEQFRSDGKLFRSMAVLFPDSPALDEKTFETALWRRLQALSDLDVAAGYAPDNRVSSNPASDDFAISFGTEGFFVLALHPGAHRKSRYFEETVLIFNLHQQFEQLRDDDVFDTMRETIIQRDTAYSGSKNTMLGDHGKASSARQYSGRVVGEDWKCPFHRKSIKEISDRIMSKNDAT